MRFQLRLLRGICVLGTLCAALLAGGCSRAGETEPAGPPISVTLDLMKVTLSQDGAPVIDQIFINSPSETAMVSFTGLPAGVSVKYAASDTSPSVSLTFMASNFTPVGSYSAQVTAMSAARTASAEFTLVVEK
jgi:hypothetical protein